MRYLLLIYGNEAAAMDYTEADNQAVLDAYNIFTKEVVDAGVMLGGEALHPTTAATTVRVRNGQTTSTDGPFAETKEHLGGYYMLNCENLDEAIKWAARIPGAKEGSIEIRPILEFEG